MLLSIASLLVSNKIASQIFVALCAIAGLLCAAVLFNEVAIQGNVLRYMLGAWPPSIGIELKLDVLGAFFLLLVNLGFFFVVLLVFAMQCNFVAGRQLTLFNSVMLLCFMGVNGVIISNDVFNIYIFLEVSSLASYALVGACTRLQSVKSAITYLIIGTLSASFYLIGIGLLYIVFGSLNIDLLAAKLASLSSSTIPVIVAFSFMVAGFFLKMAVFPLHKWSIALYEQAPRIVVLFFSAVSSKLGIYLLLKIFIHLFGIGFFSLHPPILTFLAMVSLLSIFVGGIIAFTSQSTRQILAASNLSYTGYVLLAAFTGMLSSSFASVAAIIFADSFAKLNLFALTFSGNKDSFEGLLRRSGILAFSFIVSLLTILGFPLTLGFAGKWWLLTDLLVLKQNWAAIAFLISNAITALYCYKILEIAFLGAGDKKITAAACHIRDSTLFKFTTAFLASFLLLLGVFPDFFLLLVDEL